MKPFFLDTNQWAGQIESVEQLQAAIAEVKASGALQESATLYFLSARRGEGYEGDRFGLYQEYRGTETLADFLAAQGVTV